MTFKPKFDLVEELKWRGMIHDMTPDTDALLNKEQVSGYVGIDPTADSMHLGNLVPIMLLRHLQRAGHIPIVLVGGATGLVGDPSGKKSERKLLDAEQLQHNLERIKQQLQRFLDFDQCENPALIVNNHDWFKDMGFLTFIRDVGKHISINYMMAKDSVKSRLESGISFTEFSYQLIQGYDFVHLYRSHRCKLQMGGSDQWGNITTGTELIRRMEGGEAYALTAPLLTKADGSKFGKSEGGNVWLSAEKTSPYAFYQFWLNVADEDAEKLIKVFGEQPRHDIESLIQQHHAEPHARHLQKTLAYQLTVMVHTQEEVDIAIKTSTVLFGNQGKEELLHLGERHFIQGLEGVPTYNISPNEMGTGMPLLDMLTTTGIFNSKGEARKLIQQGGLSINKSKISAPETVLTPEDLLFGKFILIQKGKKHYFLIAVS